MSYTNNEFKCGIYPQTIVDGVSVGSVLPTVPGGVKVGDFINSDLDDNYYDGESYIVIEMVVNTSDDLYIQLNRVPAGKTKIELIFDDEVVHPLTLGVNNKFEGNIAGLYSLFTSEPSNVYNFTLRLL